MSSQINSVHIEYNMFLHLKNVFALVFWDSGVNNQLFPSSFIYNTWVIWKFPYEGWAKTSPVQ